MTINSHHNIRESMRQRIVTGEWELGELIPAEMTLAAEYGCARTTINRALQALAYEGLVIRKRKGGTRVCSARVREAKFSIAMLREQVEATGGIYSHKLLIKNVCKPSEEVRSHLDIAADEDALYTETVHFSDDQPFAFEERWLNLQNVPDILKPGILENISINEWLIKTVPFSSGDVIFSAHAADQKIADALNSPTGSALFLLERTTWLNDDFITTMKLYYQTGYQLYTKI